PVKINEDGTESVRVVAVIENIPLDELLKGPFVENFGRAFSTGKNSKTALAMSQTDESSSSNTPAIDALYRELKTLGKKGTLNATDDERCWGRAQINGSCAASCISAMTRTCLETEEFRQVEINMQIKSLVKHYKLIETGKDTSSTRKLMVLDLIQALKMELNSDDRLLLEDIEVKVKKSLKMLNAELKISNSSKVDMDSLIVDIDSLISKGEGELYKFTPFIPKITKDTGLLVSSAAQQGILKANVKIEKDPTVNFHFDIKRENKRWVGLNLEDKIALLCFHVANGDHEETDACMIDLLKELNNGQKLSDEGMEKQNFTLKLLINLSDEFRNVDNTRSGIAKQLFLSTLAIDQFCKSNDFDFNEIKNDFWKIDPSGNKELVEITNNLASDKIFAKIETILHKTNTPSPNTKEDLFNERIKVFGPARGAFCQAKKIYASLNVEKILEKDNIWIKGLDSINGLQPALSVPESLQKFEGAHISELLKNELTTEGSTNQIGISALNIH
ncbi:MAG TPA: hypothetical protein VGP47_04775, partial [Parachlamydiaceae bacterium]|nr:hypothetical protein [Parachlamydiaceae bacterium]